MLSLRRFLVMCITIVIVVFGGHWPVNATGQFEYVSSISVTFSSDIVVSGSYAYVASSTNISVIDTNSNTVVDTIATAGARGPQGAAAIGTKVYFAAATDNKLIILDTQTRAVSYLATTGCSSPNQLLVVSNTRLIVNCHLSGNVQIYDVSAPAIAGTVSTGTGPRGMSTSGGLVFVPNSNADTMTVVNAAASPPVAVRTVNVGDQPEFTAFLDGKIYVVNFAGNTTSVVDASTGSVLATLAVGNNPQGVASCENNIYTSNRWTGNTSVISPSTNTVISTLALSTVGAITHVMGVNGTYAYFLNFDRSSVSVVDCSNQSVVTTVSIQPNPMKIAFSAQYAYVTGSNVISVISIGASQPGSSTSSTDPIFGFSFGDTSGAPCSRESAARVGSWVTLPESVSCTPPTNRQSVQFLGWATTPNFPVEIARRQAVNNWGVYELIGENQRVEAVYIPLGKAARIAAPVNFYPIWG